MPWKECKRMDERLRFVARLLEGGKMSRVCREFGISRPTGYKIFNRYKDLGYQGLLDRSRRPYRHANQLPFQLQSAIVPLRTEQPTWGAAKIREKLIRAFPMVPAPAKSTVHAVLDRHGLVERRKRRRYKAQGTPLTDPGTPNHLWCADWASPEIPDTEVRCDDDLGGVRWEGGVSLGSSSPRRLSWSAFAG